MTKEDGFPREDSRLAPGETLHEFFAALVVKNYSAVGLSETALTDYVTQVLEAFVRAEASRQPVAALLAASDPVYGEASSFAREAAVRRRIGDVTLFFTGMFPESLARRRRPARLRGGGQGKLPHRQRIRAHPAGNGAAAGTGGAGERGAARSRAARAPLRAAVGGVRALHVRPQPGEERNRQLRRSPACGGAGTFAKLSGR